MGTDELRKTLERTVAVLARTRETLQCLSESVHTIGHAVEEFMRAMEAADGEEIPDEPQ